MGNLGHEILSKLNVLAEYKAAIDKKSDRSQDAIDKCNRALAKASDLVRRIKSEPESVNRRFSDLDLILNNLFDDDSELQRRLGLFRGTAAISPDKRETGEKSENPLPEIENVLIKTGYPPQPSSSSPTVTSVAEQERKDDEQQNG